MDAREVCAEISGQWTSNDNYDFNNLGIAVFKSATADVYALRLRLCGWRPLLVYCLRPSNLPYDLSIITLPINKAYTKQGCLDGRCGLDADSDILRVAVSTPSPRKPPAIYHQTELGGTFSYRGAIGGGLSYDIIVGLVTTSLTADLMGGLHMNLTNTKDSSEETTVSPLFDLNPSMFLSACGRLPSR
ncbi:hypothetical protein CSUB01_11331 [Colletotrichum sublineola]|uniref:Uncharacterized protein n=1 Tax=Colletotrichum sublineola TaxID=1173701 RepID=A0A066X984_COLSU|nr:hypothetical protein CSUB01_11331 [Colletotrichum sublineola]